MNTNSKASDDALVKRVQQGDKRAFDLLVIKYQHKVMAIVSRYVRDHADASDVVQETFIKAYRAIGKFRGDSAFYTWVYRIAVNTAKNHLVARGRRPPSTDVEIDDDENPTASSLLRDTDTPEDNVFRDELEKAVFEAIEQLPEDLKAAVTLRELDGLSYEDISIIMECPVGTVRSRIFRARDYIDAHISPLLERSIR